MRKTMATRKGAIGTTLTTYTMNTQAYMEKPKCTFTCPRWHLTLLWTNVKDAMHEYHHFSLRVFPFQAN